MLKDGSTYVEARIDGLAVSRTFADCYAKYSVLRGNYHRNGVISVVPDISFIDLKGHKNLRLVLVSDGVVEDMSSQEVVDTLVETNENCVQLLRKAREKAFDDLTVVLQRI